MAVLTKTSWEEGMDRALDKVELAVAAGATAEALRRRVMLRTQRHDLAVRVEHATAYVVRRDGGE